MNLDWNRRGHPSNGMTNLYDAVSRAIGQLHLSFVELGNTFQRTVDGKIITSALDHVYHSCIGHLQCSVLGNAASDHYPVKVTVGGLGQEKSVKPEYIL